MLTENKDYCDYDTCVALKELGYNEKSNWWFNKVLNEEYDQMELVHVCDNPAHLNYDSWGICPKDFVIRPTMWEAQKWLREEKEIFVYIDVPWKTDSGLGWSYFCCNKPMTEEDKEVCFASGGFYDSYEEALSEGIKAAVKILKEK